MTNIDSRQGCQIESPNWPFALLRVLLTIYLLTEPSWKRQVLQEDENGLELAHSPTKG